MAALTAYTSHPNTEDKNQRQMEAGRVPSPSTVSTAELTRWITVTMEACERRGRGGRVGGRDLSISTNALYHLSKTNKNTYGMHSGGRDANTSNTSHKRRPRLLFYALMLNVWGNEGGVNGSAQHNGGNRAMAVVVFVCSGGRIGGSSFVCAG